MGVQGASAYRVELEVGNYSIVKIVIIWPAIIVSSPFFWFSIIENQGVS